MTKKLEVLLNTLKNSKTMGNFTPFSPFFSKIFFRFANQFKTDTISTPMPGTSADVPSQPASYKSPICRYRVLF